MDKGKKRSKLKMVIATFPKLFKAEKEKIRHSVVCLVVLPFQLVSSDGAASGWHPIRQAPTACFNSTARMSGAQLLAGKSYRAHRVQISHSK